MLSSSSSIYCFYLVRDDGAAEATVAENKKTLGKMQRVSNILFVVENVEMILLYYFRNEHPQAGFSLPITVCVCVVSV